MDNRSFENTLKAINVIIEQLLKFQESIERIKRINRRGLNFPSFFIYRVLKIKLKIKLKIN